MGEKEVNLQDFEDGKEQAWPGFVKIRGCCSLAESRGFDWVCIDTCCIDKKSSAEIFRSNQFDVPLVRRSWETLRLSFRRAKDPSLGHQEKFRAEHMVYSCMDSPGTYCPFQSHLL